VPIAGLPTMVFINSRSFNLPQSNTLAQPLAPLVLRKRALPKLLGISLAHIDRLRAKGDFPAPIRLGDQAIAWDVASIQSWLAARPLARH
jgi:predicted DNA-binding transcriptional regulator AlpA